MAKQSSVDQNKWYLEQEWLAYEIMQVSTALLEQRLMEMTGVTVDRYLDIFIIKVK